MVRFSDKIKSCEIAFRRYHNIMLEIRTALRSGEYDDQLLLNTVKIYDEMINDSCPPITNRFTKKYDKHFTKKNNKLKSRGKDHVFI